MNVVLISTYELGRQPFGLASPAAWLRSRGHAVTLVDLAVSPLPSLVIREAEVAAFHLPMHTATRLAVQAMERVRALNPKVRLIAYGLYAPLNAVYLRSIGVEAAIGGEYEEELASAVDGAPVQSLVPLARLRFLTPDRKGLPSLARYARLHVNGECRVSGYTEASRGCKHLCRHCPVVPVYQGAFRIVQPEVVIADVRSQVEAGARHICFGDPDFFNGPGHAVRVVTTLHREFPDISYDVTIKIEHLLRERALLPVLAQTGCAFVTSAVESIENTVLTKLEKGHTREDFLTAVRLCREAGLALSPTFVPFTPWTTRDGYIELLRILAELELIDCVSPIQLALRLLIPANSRLLELDDIQRIIQPFDKAALLYRWRHRDAGIDELAAAALSLVNEQQRGRLPRRETFKSLWRLATAEDFPDNFNLLPRAAIPYMDEPWYC